MRDRKFTLTFVFALIALTIQDFLCLETFKEKRPCSLETSVCVLSSNDHTSKAYNNFRKKISQVWKARLARYCTLHL